MSTGEALMCLRSGLVPVYVTSIVRCILQYKQGRLVPTIVIYKLFIDQIVNKVSEQIIAQTLYEEDATIFVVKGCAKNAIIGAGINANTHPLEFAVSAAQKGDSELDIIQLSVLESLSSLNGTRVPKLLQHSSGMHTFPFGIYVFTLR